MGFGLDMLQRQYPAQNKKYPSISYFFPRQEDEDTVKGNYLNGKSMNFKIQSNKNYLIAKTDNFCSKDSKLYRVLLLAFSAIILAISQIRILQP